jgi:hypothetical protein
MKFVTGSLAAILLLAGVGASHAVVRIADDRGGRIGAYVDKYQGLRSSGESVVIDGLCASACTIVLGTVSHDKICVTSRATLGFHAAWNFGANGRTITDREATMMLYSMYPMPVRRWIAARGGLTPQMIFLRGKVLQAMYKPCYLDAHHYFAARRWIDQRGTDLSDKQVPNAESVGFSFWALGETKSRSRVFQGPLLHLRADNAEREGGRKPRFYVRS